jgi:hypothetical protein
LDVQTSVVGAAFERVICLPRSGGTFSIINRRPAFGGPYPERAMRRLILSSLLALIAALVAAPTAAAGVDATAVLPSGDGLAPGDRLTTERTRLVMQPDGDLVFSARTADGWREIWASETAGNPGAYVLMQKDGNLVVYSPAG